MLTVGRKKKTLLTCSVIYTGRWSLKPPRKIGQSSHSDLVYFGKVCQGSKGSIHSGVMTFSRPGIPSPFTFANQRAAAAQEILSAHFLSVRKPYHALSLPLMEPHVNLLLLNICPPTPTLHEIVNELLQCPGNELKVHFWRSNVS